MCIKSQGYWKTHPNSWPVGVTSLTLGTVSYTKAQLLQILNKAANGNGLIQLAHQLIATKLNLLAGGDPGPIQSYVTNADALIGNKVVPPIGSGTLTPSAVGPTKNALDNYNNGRMRARCGFTSTEAGTWGSLKIRYR